MLWASSTSVWVEPPQIRAPWHWWINSWTLGVMIKIITAIPWGVRHRWTFYRVNPRRSIISVIPGPSLVRIIPPPIIFCTMVQALVWSTSRETRTWRFSSPKCFICIFWDWSIYTRKFNTLFPPWFTVLRLSNFPIFLFIGFLISKYCYPWWLILIIRIWKMTSFLLVSNSEQKTVAQQTIKHFILFCYFIIL